MRSRGGRDASADGRPPMVRQSSTNMKKVEAQEGAADDPPQPHPNTPVCNAGAPFRSREPEVRDATCYRLWARWTRTLGRRLRNLTDTRPNRRAMRDFDPKSRSLIGPERKQVSTETSEIPLRRDRQVHLPGVDKEFEDVAEKLYLKDPRFSFQSSVSVLETGKQEGREDGFQMGSLEEGEDVEALVQSLRHDKLKILLSGSRKVRFAGWVELLHDARHAKEVALLEKPRREHLLDETDRVEEEACCALYGLFKYAIGHSDTGDPEPFDKRVCDDEMEKYFGSLDSDSFIFREDDKLDARLLFSLYLSRKIWSPLPWRKFDDALRGFLQRTVHNQIQVPVDRDALNVARTILDTIIRLGPSPVEFQEVEVNSDSACLERSKLDGGKRVALYEEGDQMLGFKYVVPKPIYTGGKVRVITVSSAESANYNWVNKWLGACFRQLDCSVFGGDVAEWWAKQQGRFRTSEGEKYISGDLEAATDNFDSRITRFLLQDMCRYLGLSHEDEWKMRRFTTDCTFRVDDDCVKQTRGNMMGSEISFPFLCIFSLTAYICKNRRLRNKLYKSYNKNIRVALRFLSTLRVGINGDDIVFIAPDARFWEEGVLAIGGVVSKGKSLANPFYFTINSELWCRDGPLPCARPTFVTALNDGRKYFIHPAREYLEYLRSDLFVDSSIFDIERRLNLDIPVRWGGLGLCKRFDPYRCALYKLKSEYERSEARKAKLHGSRAALEEAAGRVNLYGRKVTVVMSRTMRDAYLSRFYSKKASWREKKKLEYPRELPSTARFMAGGAGRQRLFEEWKKLMVPKEKVVYDLPVDLVRAFQAEPVDMDQYNLFRKRDFGPLEFDSGTRMETSRIRSGVSLPPPTTAVWTPLPVPHKRSSHLQNQWDLEFRRLDYVSFYQSTGSGPFALAPLA